MAGTMGMKAKHLKECWFMDMKHDRAEDGVEGKGDHWRLLVKLVQAVQESETIPTQMT